jgi:hypothetical protein
MSNTEKKRTLSQVADRVARPFALVEVILRDYASYFIEIVQRRDLPRKIGRMLTVIIFGLSIFGFAAGLGAQNGIQALITAIKLPLIHLATGLICLPTLYYFSLLFHSRLRFLQAVTLILSAQMVSAILALGTAPISLLFWLSGAGPSFLIVLNAAIIALCTGLGLTFLVRGALYTHEYALEDDPPRQVSLLKWAGMFFRGPFRSAVMLCWIGIYSLSGMQLCWALRPILGLPAAEGTFWGFLADVFNYIIWGIPLR